MQRPSRPVVVNYVLALLTAVLLLLVHPPYDVGWFAPVALTPLLFALTREYRPRHRFLLGYVAGVVYWFALCHWIQFVLDYHGGMGSAGGWATYVLFSLAKAVHLGVFALLAGVVVRTAYALPAVAALWTAIEQTHGTFGFAWLTLGNAGAEMGIPLRLAPFTGTYGLSFLFALMAMAWVVLLKRRPRLHLAPLAALPLLFALPPLPPPAPGRLQAAVLQPNLDPEATYTQESLAALTDRLASLTLRSALQAGQPAPSLLAWPEVPAPFYYYRDPRFRQTVTNLAERAQAPFILGTVAYTPNNSPLNSAVALNSQGWLAGQYDKVNLVPFGEFVPPMFGWVNRITSEISDFVPGRKVSVLAVDGRRAGVFICYESVFPSFVRQFALNGADVLLNLSNDGYFGRSSARLQHLKIVRMRAVENRRWLLRATNDGYTVAIDPAGRITEAMPPYQQLAGRLAYTPESSRTLYTRWGDWFVALCAVVSAAALFASQMPSYRR